MTQTLYIHSPIKVPLFSGFLLRLFGNVDIVVGFFFFFQVLSLVGFHFSRSSRGGRIRGKTPRKHS